MQRKTKIILILILLLGFFLRVYELGGGEFSTDEIYTVMGSCPFYSLSDISSYWFKLGHFPTYFIMAHYWVKPFGVGEFVLRFPSVVFGVLSIYLVFLLGRRLFDERTGILASGIFAVSTINICYSQYARPYSMAEFFVLLSFLSLLEALGKNRGLAWGSYVFSTIFALLLSCSIFPVLICQILFVLLVFSMDRKEKTYIKKALIAFLAIVAIYAPLLLMLIIKLRANGPIPLLNWFRISYLGAVINIFNSFGGKETCDLPYRYGIVRVPGLFTNLYGVILFVLCLIGMVGCLATGKKEGMTGTKSPYESVLVLSLWLTMPFILPLLGIFLLPQQMLLGQERYVLYASVAYYLLVSRGILFLKGMMRYLLIAMLVISNFIFLEGYYQRQRMVRWKNACGYVQKNISKGERVVFRIENDISVSFMEQEMLRHHLGLPVIGLMDKTANATMGLREGALAQKLESASWERDAVANLSFSGLWLVTWGPAGSPTGMINKLNVNYFLLERKIFRDVNVYHFKKK